MCEQREIRGVRISILIWLLRAEQLIFEHDQHDIHAIDHLLKFGTRHQHETSHIVHEFYLGNGRVSVVWFQLNGSACIRSLELCDMEGQQHYINGNEQQPGGQHLLQLRRLIGSSHWESLCQRWCDNLDAVGLHDYKTVPICDGVRLNQHHSDPGWKGRVHIHQKVGNFEGQVYLRTSRE